MHVRVLALVAALAFLAAGLGLVQAADPDIEMVFGVKLPLRDGVKLNATIFNPRDMPGPLPVVFTLVDVRGRGNSEGEFMPFENEGRDGHDVVEALSRHALVTGKVAMWGG